MHKLTIASNTITTSRNNKLISLHTNLSWKSTTAIIKVILFTLY